MPDSALTRRLEKISSSSSWSARVRRSLLKKLPVRLDEGTGHAAQDSLGFLERLHLLLEGGLADVEVLHGEVAALVEVRVLGLVLLLHVQRGREILLRRHLVALRDGLRLALGRDVARLLAKREVCVLHKGLVSL